VLSCWNGLHLGARVGSSAHTGPQTHTFHKAWLEDSWAFGRVMPCFEGITLHIKHLEILR
jgi:hypothetical protein